MSKREDTMGKPTDIEIVEAACCSHKPVSIKARSAWARLADELAKLDDVTHGPLTNEHQINMRYILTQRHRLLAQLRARWHERLKRDVADHGTPEQHAAHDAGLDASMRSLFGPRDMRSALEACVAELRNYQHDDQGNERSSVTECIEQAEKAMKGT